MWGAITGAVTGGMTSPYCFVAGTLVCTVDGEEFTTTTTEGHPFYVDGRGFVKAGELRYSDTLVDSEGNKLHLDKKCKAHLENPVTVYNFAVEDCHTYFVSENGVLVHNMCAVKSIDLSNKSVNHILNRHSFTKFEQEAAHLTDEELAAKLVKRTFFNKN